MKGRQLPKTNTIVRQENSALKHKVSCLEESLKAAHVDIIKLTDENQRFRTILYKAEKIVNE